MYFITEEEDELKITHELAPCDFFFLPNSKTFTGAHRMGCETHFELLRVFCQSDSTTAIWPGPTTAKFVNTRVWVVYHKEIGFN